MLRCVSITRQMTSQKCRAYQQFGSYSRLVISDALGHLEEGLRGFLIRRRSKFTARKIRHLNHRCLLRRLLISVHHYFIRYSKAYGRFMKFPEWLIRYCGSCLVAIPSVLQPDQAPLLPNGPLYPVVMFSHGLGGSLSM